MATEELATLDEKTEEPPESRFKDANSARSHFTSLVSADKGASRDRASIQMMFDGEPPYDPAELKKAGQGFRCNVNFGEGEDLLEQSLAAYIDMLQSVEVLFTAKTPYGETDTERKEISETICKEISDMIRRRWPLFFKKFLMNATHFVSEGVSFVTFMDDIDWRFDVKRLGDFYVPRNTDASEDEAEVAYARDSFDVTELYRKIFNETAAKDMGWDVKAVKKAILNASATSGGKQYTSWEQWATEAKCDDLQVAARSKQVDVAYCWVQEFDGTISQYIFTIADGITEFLYERKEVYSRMGEAFVSFIYGVGTSGKFYGIRGLGKKVFSAVQTNNRMYGQHIDGAMLASSTFVQPKSASALGKAQLSFRGPFTVVHPDATVVPNSTPNFAQNTIPVINQMRELIRRKASGYTSANALPDDSGEMSRFEASARISNATGMTVTNLLLFIEQFEKLLREMVRRIIEPDYTSTLPGGEFVDEMMEQLEKKGIPAEAVHQLDLLTLFATRPVGAGSPAARDEVFRLLQEMSPGYDEQGRKAVLRDRTANVLGSFDAADRYIERPEVERKPEAAKIAVLENIAMSQGSPIPVHINEFHVTHLIEHTEYLQQVIQGVDEGQIQLMEAVPLLSMVHEHSVEHLQYVENDVASQADAAQYRQVLQQTGEILLNGMRQLEAQQQAEAEQAAESGEPGQVDPETEKHNLELQRKIETHQVNMQILHDKARTEQAIALQRAAGEQAVRDAEAAQKLNPFSIHAANKN